MYGICRLRYWQKCHFECVTYFLSKHRLGNKNRFTRKKAIIRQCNQAIEFTAQSCTLNKQFPSLGLSTLSPAPSLADYERFKLQWFAVQDFTVFSLFHQKIDISGDLHATTGCRSLKLKQVGHWVESAAPWWLLESSSYSSYITALLG